MINKELFETKERALRLMVQLLPPMEYGEDDRCHELYDCILDLYHANTALAKKDRLFIQEIINELKRNGFVEGGKAEELLTDWSRELREKTHLRGKTKKVFAEKVGAELY